MEEQEDLEMNELPTKILVSSLPSTVHEEFLEMFFENSKKSGGGPVVSVVYDEETASAIVEFEDPEVVENVLKKHPLKMMGQEISVEVFDPGPVTLCTIEVTGPHDLVCEEQMETLQLYFEHKRSLGDEVKDIVFDGDIALVTFFSEEVARRVAGKSNHKINKKPISVKLHSTESNKLRDDREGFARGEDETVDKNEEAENERALTVKVKGVKELPSKDAVENYIDNKRRSGGSGLQKNISYEDDDVLYVKYQSEEGLKMTENLYNIKKVGNHWLLGKAGKSFKRISVLTHVTKVQLSDNFLIADDDIIYKIQEYRDNIVLVKIDDIDVHEEQQKNEAEHFCKEKTHRYGAVEKLHEEDTLLMKSVNTRLKEKEPAESNSTFDDFREQNEFSEAPKKTLLDQTENSYSSLEVGQTEDSSVIETIVFSSKSGNCTGSGSIGQLSNEPDMDKEGTEIEGGEHALLQFQMKSLTQLPENAENLQKCDKTLAFQEQPSELHSNETRDTEKPRNSPGEAEESNTCGPQDLKKTKLGGSDKNSMSVKNYSLKKFGHDYLLFSENHNPVKMDILKGETNVALEENLILINDEVKYYFTDEEGDITFHEIGEAISIKKSNISGRKESKEKQQNSLFPTTSYEKKEEKLSTEVGKKSNKNFEERATSPQSDELLRGPDYQSSQRADSPKAGDIDACLGLIAKLNLKDSETNSEDPSESTQTQTDIFPGKSGSKDKTKTPKPKHRRRTHGDGRETCQGQSSHPVPPPRLSRENDKHQSLHGNELKSEGQDQPVEETKTGKQDKKAENLVLQQPDVSGRNVSKEEKSSGKQSRSFDIPVWLFHGEKGQFLLVRLRSHSDHVKLLYLMQNEKALKLLNEKMKNYGVQVRENQIEISVKEEEGNKCEFDRIIQNHLGMVVDNIPNLYSEEMKLENDGCSIMQVMMNTDLAKEKLLYAHCFQEEKIFVFVCQEDVKEIANQECLKALKHRNLYPEHIKLYERKFPVNIACKVVFDTCNIKQQISERFPGVIFSYEIDGKDKICQWYLKGPDENGLEETASFLEAFLDEHPFSSVLFSDIIKDRKIDKETFKTVLSNELKCFIETGAIVTFDIDIEMERVTVVGQSQKEVDTVQSKLRKLLKELEIGLPSEVCGDLLSEIKLEGTDRVSIVSSGNKCCCIGRSEVIKMLKEKCQTFIKEKKKKDEEESKLSLKPYLVTEDSGGKPENKRSRTVEIEDLNVFKILKNKLCKEQGSLEIIPTECNGKYGFIIKAYEYKALLAAEQNIRQLQSNITDKLLSLEFPESKVNEFVSLKSNVEDSCSVDIKVKSKDYKSPDGTTVRVSLGNAEDHWETLLVEGFQGEGKPTLEKHDGKMLTQLYVPVYNMEPGEADGTYALQDSAQRVLKLIKSNEIIHVCLSIYQRHGWPLKKFTKQILKALKSYMKNCHSIPVVFELCLEDKGEFRQCLQIMNETLKEYDPDSDGCEEEQDLCRETKQSKSVQVCIVSGKLHEFKADVLVNTTSTSLDLNSGAVSKALLSTAGQELQKECRHHHIRHHYKNGIKEGQITVTKGYKLHCKNVFHGSVPRYKKENERECLQELDSFIMACLDEAIKMQHTSIAFPAIGTGNLQYPTEKVAMTMFKSVKKFADKQYAARSEKELAVYFVIFPLENLHIFSEFKKDYFEAAVTTEKTNSCVFLSVEGLPHDIDQAVQRLKKWSKSSETQPPYWNQDSLQKKYS